MHRIAFFIVPCSVAFIALGEVVAAAVFQTGQFTARDSRYVWAILAGSAVGLLASTLSRLSSSAFYALGDTRSPLRYALVRVGLTTGLGFAAALLGPPLLGLDQRWGAVGLTATAGFAGWVEFLLLRRRLAGIIGTAQFVSGYLVKLWGAALAGALLGYLVRLAVAGSGPIPTAIAALGTYGVVYGTLTLAMKIPAAQALYGSVRRRV
jgi:putative peptidoglycan lipid II flippase